MTRRKSGYETASRLKRCDIYLSLVASLFPFAKLDICTDKIPRVFIPFGNKLFQEVHATVSTLWRGSKVWRTMITNYSPS